MNNIRNFSIIAHIDHGKSTLADRMLEITGTIEKYRMKDQVLDSMELERERGITIKMQPVRMKYKNFILNLIDTPGHIDFSYEVSRALSAVEGSILLVDATQGVQAQTLTTLEQAAAAGLAIIPVISKIDSPLARIEEAEEEIEKLLNVKRSEILRVSGKTGEGVEELLEEIIKRVPPPRLAAQQLSDFQSLVFDFKYSSHKGVIVFVRVFSGRVGKGDNLRFKVAGKKFKALEVGTFLPEETPGESLQTGEIGYIVTGIKEPGIASVGDTIAGGDSVESALPGYESPRPVVWASVYPENQDNLNALRLSLGKLRLTDAAFSFEEESSGVLGRGFRCGFLGMLHLEIITERLRREFGLPLVITLPSITYRVIYKNGKEEMIYTPSFFPEEHLLDVIWEPWIIGTIIMPPDYLGEVIKLLHEFEGENLGFGTQGSQSTRTMFQFQMPLRELMRGFFDRLKSATSGFGSISYVLAGERKADVARLDILVADEAVPAFAKVISRKQVEAEAEKVVDRLFQILPRQMFTLKIQARALGRIISSRTLSGMKKDVTQHMYGGDITRKMKLREKQKRGKKKMKERGRVNIPQDVFLKMLKQD
ncbi:MAG: elongation factor 4 [Candidatus Zambryskibacteria bacterium RIFCSPLOWO2_01_FULL_52_12]|nr:MAG: elongation factor 4 [Candidatus Zambryskibacteria bacterium RIFCSPLOWO2_01_FULL_52_12]